MKYYWADSVLNCIIDKLIVFSIFSIFDSFVDTPKLNGYNKLDNKPDLSSILYGRNASTLQIFAYHHPDYEMVKLQYLQEPFYSINTVK
jgi:hypothetical protein